MTPTRCEQSQEVHTWVTEVTSRRGERAESQGRQKFYSSVKCSTYYSVPSVSFAYPIISYPVLSCSAFPYPRLGMPALACLLLRHSKVGTISPVRALSNLRPRPSFVDQTLRGLALVLALAAHSSAVQRSPSQDLCSCSWPGRPDRRTS